MDYKKENIIGYEEYQIDTNGIIYGKSGKPLKYSRNKKGNGYCIVQLRKNNKTSGHSVHVLVAKQFLPNPDNKPTVNHIDGDKTNNSVNNLEWATYKEQIRHSFDVLGTQPINKKPIQGFDKKTNQLIYEFDSLMNAGRYFAEKENIDYRRSEHSIWRALKGIRKSYKGCIWKYK